MTIGHHYLCGKLYTSANALTPLHGGATIGLKSMTNPHCDCFTCVYLGRVAWVAFPHLVL